MTELLLLAAFGLYVLTGALLGRAAGRLTPEDKLKLVDAFGGWSTPAGLAFLVLFAALLAGARRWPLLGPVLFNWYGVVAIAYTLVASVVGMQKLRSLGMPASYSRDFVLSRILKVATLGLIFWSAV